MKYSQAQKYLLEERHLTPETISKFNIAFCDSKGYLYASTSFPKDFVHLTDAYFNCIIFPIYDLYGTCVGVMARRMYNSANKYINSASSNVFTKGKHLYGLHASHSAILAADQAIVVEGLFDFLQLHQQGVPHVVATMGTALTDTHIALLSRFTRNVVFIPDPDQAGERFGRKSEKTASKYVDCRYLALPSSKDPDEYIREVGVDRFTTLLTVS